jgi:hypothetical protein
VWPAAVRCVRDAARKAFRRVWRIGPSNRAFTLRLTVAETILVGNVRFAAVKCALKSIMRSRGTWTAATREAEP